MLKSRYIMVGGFLGAGKTTAILELAKRFNAQKKRIGLITNDQSVGLVDTAILRSKGFETEEITGGCFCCKFESLVEASNALSAVERPDVFIAEPVGSCTDLRATVNYPLQKLYGDQFAVAPLSVVLDPIRTMRVLGLDQSKTFSPKVLYVFTKQIEEADILVINKCDLISDSDLDRLKSAIEDKYPGKTIVETIARTGDGIDRWLSLLMETECSVGDSMEIDYDEYAEGEALLGWLNMGVTVSGDDFDGNRFLSVLADTIQQRLGSRGIEIAHLKMTLTPDMGSDMAAGNLVRTNDKFELSHELSDPLSVGELILNLRAESDASVLKGVVIDSLTAIASESNLTCMIGHAEAFQPGRPTPTHRLMTP